MFDTMTMTKAVGGFCGAFLIYLLGGWAGESLYSVGGHGGEEVASYVIEVEDAGPCHKIDGSNATGPHLDGVVGRAIDAVDGFSYSGALLQVGDTWTPENLFHFLESPRNAASGTTMSFAGLPKPQDRVDLIAYLDSLDG